MSGVSEAPFTWLMSGGPAICSRSQGNEGGYVRTKIDHVEHSPFTTFTDSRKQLSIVTNRNSNDTLDGGAIVLDELDAFLLLFPKLDMSVDTGCDDEIGSEVSVARCQVPPTLRTASIPGRLPLLPPPYLSDFRPRITCVS